MKVQLFNFYYFFYIFIFAGITVGLYFLLRKKSLKTKFWVIEGLLIFNLALHFFKAFIPPYNNELFFTIRHLFFINICAMSVLTFPFIFFSKSKHLKDYMFYIGVISGFLSLIYPTEAINSAPFALDTIRFYLCHGIIFISGLLPVVLKVHKLDFKRIWAQPFIFMTCMALIMFQEVIGTELGLLEIRGSGQLTDIRYPNFSMQWGPDGNPLASVFTIFTPDFMTKIPFGPYVGQTKYWPLFYLFPGMLIYLTIVPFLMCLPWQHKEIRQMFKNFFDKFKIKKT